jgi:hypothetical protein
LLQKPQIAFDSLSLTGASLKLDLDNENPNTFAMKIDGLEYTARLGDEDNKKTLVSHWAESEAPRLQTRKKTPA